MQIYQLTCQINSLLFVLFKYHLFKTFLRLLRLNFVIYINRYLVTKFYIFDAL